jgi:hypothetical protein
MISTSIARKVGAIAISALLVIAASIAASAQGVANITRDGSFTVVTCKDGKQHKVYHQKNGKCGRPNASTLGSNENLYSFDCSQSVNEAVALCR